MDVLNLLYLLSGTEEFEIDSMVRKIQDFLGKDIPISERRYQVPSSYDIREILEMILDELSEYGKLKRRMFGGKMLYIFNQEKKKKDLPLVKRHYLSWLKSNKKNLS